MSQLDPSGVWGEGFHYAMVILFSGSAFIFFFYLWNQGRLDMDEEPKSRMMEEEDLRGK